LDVTKTSDIRPIKNKNKTKTTKNIKSGGHSRNDVQSLDTNFMTVTPINSSCDDIEHDYLSPSIDLNYWKDEWQVYAEMISKVIAWKRNVARK